MPKIFRASLSTVALLLAACGADAVSTLEFVEFVPPNPKLGQVTTARFRVLDYRGLPQAGVNVTFKLESPNERVKLLPLSGMTEKGSGIEGDDLLDLIWIDVFRQEAGEGAGEPLAVDRGFTGTVMGGDHHQKAPVLFGNLA